MIELLKNAIANVSIEVDGEIVFKKSNLFVDTGRTFLRDVLYGGLAFGNPEPTPTTPWFEIELGDNTNVPQPTDDISLSNTLTPSLTLDPSNSVFTKAKEGTTQINYSFVHVVSDTIIFKEARLVYNDGSTRVLLARLRTTYADVTVASGKTMTVIWKLLL